MGLDKKFHEAFYYWLHTALIVAGAGVLLVPHFARASWCSRRWSTASSAVRPHLHAAPDQRS